MPNSTFAFRLSRRSVLLALAAAGLGGAIAGGFSVRDGVAAGLRRELIGLLPEICGAAAALRPPQAMADADRDELVRQLFGGQVELFVDAPRLVLLNYISHAVAADYAQGRVVDVDGWQLSRTEARLLALSASDS